MINVFQFTRSFAMKVLSLSLKDSLDILQSYIHVYPEKVSATIMSTEENKHSDLEA